MSKMANFEMNELMERNMDHLIRIGLFTSRPEVIRYGLRLAFKEFGLMENDNHAGTKQTV